MSKLLKSLLIASLVVCMTVCLGIFAAACNNAEDDGCITIKVVLPDANSTPVSGAEVGVCTMNGSLTTCLDEAGVTDSNGVLKFDVTDYADTTQFLIKLHNLPDGYIYADKNGDEYTGGNGMIFDTEVLKSTTFTIVLTENGPEVSADTIKTALANKTYSFTAPADGTYLFTVSNFNESWTLGEDEITNGNFETLDMNANESVSITVDENCKILVNDFDTVNTSENPCDLELDKTVSFDVMIISVYSIMQRDYVVTWGLYDYCYYLNFTSENAGNYKVTLTSSFEDDDVDVSLSPLDSWVYPDVNGDVFSGVQAGEAYEIALDGSWADYSSLNAGTVIHYTVKIEYVGADVSEDEDENEDQNSEAISLNLGPNSMSPVVYNNPITCTYSGTTANAEYTVTVTLSAGDWSLGDGVTIMAQTTTVTADENGLLTFQIGYEGWDADSGAFTLTLALAE